MRILLGFTPIFAAILLWPAQAPAIAAPKDSICDLLLRNAIRENSAIMISAQGMKVAVQSDPLNGSSNSNKNLDFIAMLANIPFAREMVREIPSLGILDWSMSGSNAIAIIATRDGNLISVLIDNRGLIEIRIGASDDRDRDDKLFQASVAILQSRGGEALLFGKSYLFPRDPEDGFELWITRLDGNRKQSRHAVNEILRYLSTH